MKKVSYTGGKDKNLHCPTILMETFFKLHWSFLIIVAEIISVMSKIENFYKIWYVDSHIQTKFFSVIGNCYIICERKFDNNQHFSCWFSFSHVCRKCVNIFVNLTNHTCKICKNLNFSGISHSCYIYIYFLVLTM